ncbi:MAG: flagellar hook-basal body complex protein FliE [Bacteroidetes bacterium]|nr:flagellar hook-basal body complex protein FliE [Bacteroidota bacterium]MCL5035322.1 flagellar hook-basal body complex protein FliE [Bacteroidota bacterium]
MLSQISPDISANKSAQDVTGSFEQTLDGFVNNVNDLQNKANDAMDKMASGQAADVHEVMIAMEKAKISFDLLLQVRNKMLDAYKQIMQMQV